MSKKTNNYSHDYSRFAAVYSELGITNTYYLYYRDIPDLVNTHCQGKQALDFGCGGGRSTRFLKELGFNVIGIDVNPELRVIDKHQPLARGDEPFIWHQELHVPFWNIFVLGKNKQHLP